MCSYKLEDEPSLKFEWLVSIDGNNSLKRWDTQQYGVVPLADSRKARSDFWLSETNVNRFQHDGAKVSHPYSLWAATHVT